MGKFWRLIGRMVGEDVTYVAAAANKAGGGGQASYLPDFTAQLVGLRCDEGGGAATGLMNHLQWKLTSTSFKPESIEAGVSGRGLQTAPATAPKSEDFPVDQPVVSGTAITIEARNLNAETPVGVDSFLYACFVM